MSADTLDIRVRVAFSEFELNMDERLDLSGVTAVIGPSGSGKSTLLRAIAGFAAPAEGRIACGAETWFDLEANKRPRINTPAHKRPVGYLFQDGRLFPHMNVASNLAYAAKRSRPGGPTPESVIDALDLAPLLLRRPSNLSGGERQRAALGRTLLTHPSLLLLDEPLSALDDDRKRAILPYLETVQTRFELPTLYVSHNIDEVARLADRALVLNDGAVVAHGPLQDVLERLDLSATYGVFEPGAVLNGVVARQDTDSGLAQIDVGAPDLLKAPLSFALQTGDKIRIRIRARDVAIALERPQRISIQNCLPARILEIESAAESAMIDILVEIGDQHARARITADSAKELDLIVDQNVFVLVKTVSFDGRI